ncbi:MAG: MBL fold metallo-hydrolase [Parasporobacterium sp.]|nr:MBL fold metallo-hydrolase [Parasporobacterium sp.]
MQITNDVKYVGVNDHKIDLFESQYKVPKGMAYNSYAVIDEKIAVIDSVEKNFTDVWFANIDNALGGRTPDYLVVQHMEPDHSSSILQFTNRYPEATVVSSAKAFTMMFNFYGKDFTDKRIVIAEGDTLELGSHTLNFYAAPMVHWPEVMVTYDSKDKVLFSADGFGKFGANDIEEEWDNEARRYYFGIVGKYGQQVQALLKKAAKLDIEKICPLHGPVLSENLSHYINQYNTWSSYTPEADGIVLAYTSVYGNTRTAVELLKRKLEERCCTKIIMHDLARTDMSKAVEDAFRYSKLVLATTTYNAEIFPFMKEFLNHLTERGFQNRTVALIENGSWAPQAARIMKSMLADCKNIKFTENSVRLLSSLNAESVGQVIALADELAAEATSCELPAPEEKTESTGKGFICKICGYIYEGDTLPEDFECPCCKHGAEDFEPLS